MNDTFTHDRPGKVEQFCQSQAPTAVVERRIAEVSFGNCSTQLQKAWSNVLMLRRHRKVTRSEIAELAEIIKPDVAENCKRHVARWLPKKAYVLGMVLRAELSDISSGDRKQLTITQRAKRIRIKRSDLEDLEREVLAIIDARTHEAASALNKSS